MSQANLKVQGYFKVVHRDIRTGEIIDSFENKNIITDLGMDQIFGSFADPLHTPNPIDTISVGDDVGSGTILNPEQPTTSFTSADHSSVYVVPAMEFSVSYPAGNVVRFFATLNGSDVMAGYPSEPNVIYTSAMLRMSDGEPFAYRRFPARTISELISVEITWEISIVQQ